MEALLRQIAENAQLEREARVESNRLQEQANRQLRGINTNVQNQ